MSDSDITSNETIVVGRCKCGGYGVVLDDEAEARFGACHLTEDPVSVLRLDTDPLRIRVERRKLGGWRAVVFDRHGGALAGGTFTASDRGEVEAEAVGWARTRGRQTLSVEWESETKGVEADDEVHL